jgi:hypothetical protein
MDLKLQDISSVYGGRVKRKKPRWGSKLCVALIRAEPVYLARQQDEHTTPRIVPGQA